MGESTSDLGRHVLDALIGALRSLKRRAEKAFGQLDDEEFFFRLDEEANSVCVTIKHLAGNMRSRWTDFLTSDGEKADRHRDGEFIEQVVPRERIIETWESGWRCLFDALEGLVPEDLTRTVYVRTEPATALDRILSQFGHYSYHVGQIFTLCKHIRGERWQYLSIPRGQSEQWEKGV